MKIHPSFYSIDMLGTSALSDPEFARRSPTSISMLGGMTRGLKLAL